MTSFPRMAGVAALLSPAAAFVTPTSPAALTPTVAPSQTGQVSVSLAADSPLPGRSAQSSQTQGTAALTAAGAAALVTGLAGFNKRRAATSARVLLDKPTLVVEWQVDPKEPKPGSGKALEDMVGSDVEMGDKPWDPLGFGRLYDINFDMNNIMTYPHVQWHRESELKHGRICMLAFVGCIAQQFVHIPGLPVEPDWTKAVDACYDDQVAALGLVQISIFTMIVEGKFYPGDAWIGQLDREPGDLGFDPFKLAKKPGFDLKKLQLQEIKNGRLAMIGMASLAANHAIPGSVPMLTGLF